jgi:hypothetical protein
MLRLGDKTEYGTVQMIGRTGGERYYWMVDDDGVVSMMPAIIMEAETHPPTGQGMPAGQE